MDSDQFVENLGMRLSLLIPEDELSFVELEKELFGFKRRNYDELLTRVCRVKGVRSGVQM